MTNREQIAWAINYSEYEDSEIAEEICEMIDAVGGISYDLKEPIRKWLSLNCNPETNNWGELDEKDRADYEAGEQE